MPYPTVSLTDNPGVIYLSSVRPGRQFNILASMFILDNAGNLVPLLPWSVTSISYTVWQVPDNLPPEITNPRMISGSGSFIPSAVIYPTMLTGTAWSVASPLNGASGYNANFPIPGSFIPNQATTYEVQITTTLLSGTVFDDWYSTCTYNTP